MYILYQINSYAGHCRVPVGVVQLREERQPQHLQGQRVQESCRRPVTSHRESQVRIRGNQNISKVQFYTVYKHAADRL